MKTPTLEASSFRQQAGEKLDQTRGEMEQIEFDLQVEELKKFKEQMDGEVGVYEVVKDKKGQEVMEAQTDYDGNAVKDEEGQEVMVPKLETVQEGSLIKEVLEAFKEQCPNLHA